MPGDKTRPTSVPLSFYFCGWNQESKLIRKKIKKTYRSDELVKVTDHHGYSPISSPEIAVMDVS